MSNETLVGADVTGWCWYSGHNDERLDYGPHYTRDVALLEASLNAEIGESVYVVEARCKPLLLSNFVDVVDVLVDADDKACDEYQDDESDRGIFSEITNEQCDDLTQRIERLLNEWQAEHGLVFIPDKFTEVRNGEWVVVEADDADGSQP